MLSGINTDIEHDGKTYHIQTEDGGHQNPVIVTHLFVGGAILSSKKTSYADLIKHGLNPEAIREMMKEQHQGMIKSVTAGRLGEAPSAAASGEPPEAAEPPPRPNPRMPAGRRTLDEVIEEFLASRPDQPS